MQRFDDLALARLFDSESAMLVGFLLRYVCCRTDMRELQLYIETRTSLRSDESIQCYKSRERLRRLCPKVSSLCTLCVLCASVVIFPKQSLTTETQRTQRGHREETFRASPLNHCWTGNPFALLTDIFTSHKVSPRSNPIFLS